MTLERQYRRLLSGPAPGPLAALLRGALGALEVPYAWFVRRRNARFDCGRLPNHKVAAPVISVGNLTVGGTGKTPFVAWVARWLANHGAAVTIISRGYGARPGQPNDEALELAAQLPGVPHLQSADRTAAARQALAANPRQVLLLDDAFQHRRLARDLDIVLLDALAPFGYDHLLPRGLLREPVENLARAHVVALSRSTAIGPDERAAIEARVRGVAPRAIWLEVTHRPAGLIAANGERVSLEELRGRSVSAFCGIGNPAGFRHTLAECGLSVADWQEFPDHCRYAGSDLDRLTRWLASSHHTTEVICTRKDLVKFPRIELSGKRLLALEIDLEIVRGQSALEALLEQTLARH